MNNFKPRHYAQASKEQQGVVQFEDIKCLPWSILELAHEEYARQGHRQSLERIQERGGFAPTEVIQLLADYVERVKDEWAE